ncbi:MAG TPA: imidazole glycerol phosphate synthase subunit HisH [Actinomycetota bacterium]|nr:imidazole glycerol phosphate synthase subunit HisH [Actinomycetota bacterium]
MKVAVLDHGMGNLRSVAKAIEAAGADVTVTGEAADVQRSDALCVPGQGIFGRCMENLTGTGMDDLIRSWIDSSRPYLGICLGMQVLFDRSDEGDRKGLGVLAGEVKKLPGGVTVPHIGWNTVLSERRASPPLVGSTYFYFDHSYAAHPDDDSVVAGWCEHGSRFAARVERGPILGVQFHPEKSGSQGIALLKEWISDR